MSTAISTLLSGWLLQRYGWQVLLYMTAGLAAIVLLASIWLTESNRKVPQFAKASE